MHKKRRKKREKRGGEEGEEKKGEVNVREGLVIWVFSGSVKKGLNKFILCACPQIWTNSRQKTIEEKQ